MQLRKSFHSKETVLEGVAMGEQDCVVELWEKLSTFIWHNIFSKKSQWTTHKWILPYIYTKNSLSNQIFFSYIAKLLFSRYIIREPSLNELHFSHCSHNPSKTDLHTVKTVFLIELDWTVWQIAYYLYFTWRSNIHCRVYKSLLMFSYQNLIWVNCIHQA